MEEQGRGQKEPGAADALQKQAQQGYDKLLREAKLSDIEKELQVRLREASDRGQESRRAKEANDVRSKVESMLKLVGEKTDDKQAVKLLEQALKLLKEPEKPKAPGELPRNKESPVPTPLLQ